MTLFLAMTAAATGLVFECKADSAYLTVFAPAEEVTANYRGNVLALYEVSGDGEVVSPQKRIRQVFDALPDSLYIKMTAPEFDMELEISAYDAEASTSQISITGSLPERQPETITGTCTVTQREEAAAQ